MTSLAEESTKSTVEKNSNRYWRRAHLQLFDLLLQLRDKVLLALEFGGEAADLAVLPASHHHAHRNGKLTITRYRTIH